MKLTSPWHLVLVPRRELRLEPLQADEGGHVATYDSLLGLPIPLAGLVDLGCIDVRGGPSVQKDRRRPGDGWLLPPILSQIALWRGADKRGHGFLSGDGKQLTPDRIQLIVHAEVADNAVAEVILIEKGPPATFAY